MNPRHVSHVGGSKHMNMQLVRVILVLASAAAGFCIALVLLNRRLLLLKDSGTKRPVILFVFAVLTGSFALAGFLLPMGTWVYVPAAALALILAGELHRLVLRRICRGSAPVDTVPHKIALLRPFTTTDVVVHRFSVVVPNWQGAPFCVVHLSDLHVNPRLPIDYYKRVFELAQETQPDLAFLTGDFVTKAESVTALAQILRPLGRLGTFATLGNHDYWAGVDAVRPVIRNSGMTLLTDDSVRLQLEGGTMQVSGCDYPWSGAKCTVPVAPEGMLRMVLSHTPDNIYRISRQSADFVFSGHYHAGQLRIPVIGPIVIPSVYGRRFDHGHFVVNGTHLFVASGVGAASPPYRVYCQPDIFVVEVAGGQSCR